MPILAKNLENIADIEICIYMYIVIRESKLPNPENLSDFHPISVSPILSRLAEKNDGPKLAAAGCDN
jgi:hypothetical protein